MAWTGRDTRLLLYSGTVRVRVTWGGGEDEAGSPLDLGSAQTPPPAFHLQRSKIHPPEVSLLPEWPDVPLAKNSSFWSPPKQGSQLRISLTLPTPGWRP